MVKCHLSRLMGERKLKISDLSRDTEINRGTVTRLYHETAERVDIEVINSLCLYFNCSVGDLFEYIPDSVESHPDGHEEQHSK
jgi:putative transcriptional regulator